MLIILYKCQILIHLKYFLTSKAQLDLKNLLIIPLKEL